MLQQAQQQQKPAQSRDQGRADFEAKAKAAGIDVNTLKSLHTEMRSAVQDALKNAAPGADRPATVQQAIDGVLQKHGIDPAKLKQQFQAAGLKPPGQYNASGKTHSRGHHSGGAKSAQDADGDNDGSTAIASALQDANAGSLVDMAA
jgi:hypothetical protein